MSQGSGVTSAFYVGEPGLDFVAVDVETANYHRGSVCSIGAAVVRGGAVVSQHSWLCRPPEDLDFFDEFNVELHGISPERVAHEPRFVDRLPELLTVADGLPLVAHNAAFDLGAIREACIYSDQPWPTLDYSCSLVMARRALDLISYRLPLVAFECGIDLPAHHDASADALACALVVLEIARRHGAQELGDLLQSLEMLSGRLTPGTWQGCRSLLGARGYPAPPTADIDADPDHPLYGQVIVFTGALSIRRVDAWEQVAACGATPEQGVTKRTTRLVIGDGFGGNDPSEFYTGKAAKAVKWRSKGHDIEVLTERDLVELLHERVTAGQYEARQPSA